MNKTVVLVVEDDRPIRNLIVTTLKMHDYKYLTANNGVSAIMEASSHHPDIVLLDLGLPDMEGVDVIKKIRTWSNMPKECIFNCNKRFKNLWLQFFLSQNQGFMRLFEKTVLK